MTLSVARKVSLVGMCLALLMVSAQVSLPILLVPVTLQTLAVGVIGTTLPWRLSRLVIGSYLMLGMLGLPVFANYASGTAVLVGPTGGYLIGFIAYVAIVHYSQQLFGQSNRVLLGGNVLASIMQLGFGTLWLIWSLKLSVVTGLMTGFVPYFPIEMIKSCLVVMIASRVQSIS